MRFATADRGVPVKHSRAGGFVGACVFERGTVYFNVICTFSKAFQALGGMRPGIKLRASLQSSQPIGLLRAVSGKRTRQTGPLSGKKSPNVSQSTVSHALRSGSSVPLRCRALARRFIPIPFLLPGVASPATPHRFGLVRAGGKAPRQTRHRGQNPDGLHPYR